jgi:uncharacterized protein
MKIFFVTDIHGSDICWRKFLNAGPFYGADVAVVGGDLTGKAMVPIVARGACFETNLQGHHVILKTGEEVRAVEQQIRNRGYYPLRVSQEEYRHMQEDPEIVDKRFKEAMIGSTERWMDMASERLQGKVHRVIVSPANDDMFEVDEVLRRPGHVVEMGGEDPLDLDGFTMLSFGWTNPTPWDTFREAPEDELRERLAPILAKVPDPGRTIFNFHAPPYDSGLDSAPELDENLRIKAGGHAMKPVGSIAVREAIEQVQPLLSLHGHIHESRGVTRIGRTFCVNPGSSYEDGSLEGALITLDAKKAKIKTYMLVNG